MGRTSFANIINYQSLNDMPKSIFVRSR